MNPLDEESDAVVVSGGVAGVVESTSGIYYELFEGVAS